MSSVRIGNNDEEKGEGIKAGNRRKNLPVLRAVVQAERQNESNMPSGSLPSKAVSSGDVYRIDREPSKQTKSRRRGNLSLGGLILARKLNDSVLIETSDGPIRVSVVSIKNDRVRISFNAPESVFILRSELSKKEPAA